MTTTFLDNKICTFKIFVVAFPTKETAFWTIFLSAPSAPPLKQGKFYVSIVVSPSLRLAEFCATLADFCARFAQLCARCAEFCDKLVSLPWRFNHRLRGTHRAAKNSLSSLLENRTLRNHLRSTSPDKPSLPSLNLIN